MMLHTKSLLKLSNIWWYISVWNMQQIHMSIWNVKRQGDQKLWLRFSWHSTWGGEGRNKQMLQSLVMSQLHISVCYCSFFLVFDCNQSSDTYQYVAPFFLLLFLAVYEIFVLILIWQAVSIGRNCCVGWHKRSVKCLFEVISYFS